MEELTKRERLLYEEMENWKAKKLRSVMIRAGTEDTYPEPSNGMTAGYGRSIVCCMPAGLSMGNIEAHDIR